MSKCKRCGAEIRWPQPYTAGARPLEADGSGPHDCPAYKRDSGSSSYDNGESGFVQRTQQVQPAAAAHPTPEEWNALFDKIGKMSETMTMQAKFYEDLVTEMQSVSKSVHKSFLIQDKADQFLQECRITDAKIDRILTRVDSITGTTYVERDKQDREEPPQRKLARQEEEFDRDREDGTIGFGGG